MGRSDGLRTSVLALLTALLVASCTFTRKSVDNCKTNADCRTAFGTGFVCGNGGLCDTAPANPRCATSFPADLLTRPQNYPGVITIGSLMDRSVQTQVDRQQAIQLVTQQVNDVKGLDGHSYGVVFCDVAADPKYDSLARQDAAVAAGKYLAEVIGVPAIVGPSASDDAIAVFNAIKGDGVLEMSPSASSPQLTTADITQTPTDQQPGLLWRTVAPDTLQGQAISIQLGKSNPVPQHVVVIDEQGAYGTSLAGVFSQAYQQNGRTVTTLEFTNSSERDAAIVTAVNAPIPPYVLFFSSQTPDAVAFLNAAKPLAAYDSVQFFLTDSAANTDLLTGAAGASALFPRVIGSRPAIPSGQTYELFETSYNAAFKEDPGALGFAPQAYDATWLVFYGTAYALRQEKKITGLGIARGLRKISSTGTPVAVSPANWVTISNSIGAGTPINLDGASGKLDYDPATEETTSLIDIWKIGKDNQSIDSVTQIDPTASQ